MESTDLETKKEEAERRKGFIRKTGKRKSGVKLMVYIKGWLAFSVKGLLVLILGFADHIRSLLHVICLQPFQNVKTILSS